MTLSLDRQPAGDLIKGTTGTWLEALLHVKSWDQQRDTPRIREAFTTLAATCTHWPQPKHLLDALPELPREYFTALGYDHPNEPRTVSPETRKIIDDLAKKLRVN